MIWRERIGELGGHFIIKKNSLISAVKSANFEEQVLGWNATLSWFDKVIVIKYFISSTLLTEF